MPHDASTISSMSTLRGDLAGTLWVPADVVFRSVGERTVVMNLGTGQYLALEETGREIWRRLVEHGSLDGAVAALSAEFDVDEATCRADVTAFVQNVSSLGLLGDVREPDTAPPAVLRLDHDGTAVASSDAIAAAAEHFRQHAFVKLAGVLASPLVDAVLHRLDHTAFYEREHHGIGVEACAVQ